jgi:hypothetical protein
MYHQHFHGRVTAMHVIKRAKRQGFGVRIPANVTVDSA